VVEPAERAASRASTGVIEHDVSGFVERKQLVHPRGDIARPRHVLLQRVGQLAELDVAEARESETSVRSPSMTFFEAALAILRQARRPVTTDASSQLPCGEGSSHLGPTRPS